MLARTAGLSALLALTSNALLLPPDVSFETTASSDSPSTFGVDPNRRFVELDCPGCPFAETQDDGSLAWNQGIKNSLGFEFGNGEKQDSLTVNGAKLFPPSLSLIPAPIYVRQMPTSIDESRFDLDKFFKEHPYPLDLRLTGYEFRFDSAETISEDGNELLPMTLSIHSLAGQPIPARTFHIFVIKSAEGTLSIASVDTTSTPAELPPSQPNSPDGECTTPLCRLKTLLESKVHDLKTSFRRPGCPKMENAGRPHREGKPPHSIRPLPHNHDGHRHHRQHPGKVHRLLRAVAHVAAHVLLFVVVASVVGALTYTVGMVVGMMVGLIWLKLRGRRAGYERVMLVEDGGDEEEGGDDEERCEKEVYVVEGIAEVEGEMLPPPAYRDVEEKEVVV